MKRVIVRFGISDSFLCILLIVFMFLAFGAQIDRSIQ